MAEEPAEEEADRMTEEEAEIETDQTEMEEAEGEEKREQECVINSELQGSASSEPSADFATWLEEEMKAETDHLVETDEATVEEEETVAEEEAAEVAVALAASQLILPLHQGNQYP